MCFCTRRRATKHKPGTQRFKHQMHTVLQCVKLSVLMYICTCVFIYVHSQTHQHLFVYRSHIRCKQQIHTKLILSPFSPHRNDEGHAPPTSTSPRDDGGYAPSTPTPPWRNGSPPTATAQWHDDSHSCSSSRSSSEAQEKGKNLGCKCACVRVRACACMCARVRACVHVCACTCGRVRVRT